MKKIPRILLADDNLDDQSFIRDAFSYVNANIELEILNDGQELLEHLHIIKNEEIPSLIVLDYNMPKLNGVQVLEILLREKRLATVPKIMLSTSFYQHHIDLCLKMGADGYLIKPDNVFAWKKVVLNMLSYIKEPRRTVI